MYANRSDTGHKKKVSLIIKADSKSARTRITIAFCNTVANSGHTPMVYASKSWFSDHLNVSQFPGSYRIWVAHYANKCGYTGRYDMWHQNAGAVSTVSAADNGKVDARILYLLPVDAALELGYVDSDGSRTQ